VLNFSVWGSKSPKFGSVGISKPKIPYNFVIKQNTPIVLINLIFNLKNLKFTLNIRTIITLRKQQKLFLHDFVAISRTSKATRTATSCKGLHVYCIRESTINIVCAFIVLCLKLIVYCDLP